MKVQWLAGVLALVATPVLAQPGPVVVPPDPAAGAQAQARFQMRIMESVLESAVQHGAQTLSVQLRRLSPDLSLFSGPARARGFRLDGYGAFFCVDVPSLHRSLTWSVRTLAQANGDITRALQSIRRIVQAQNDARTRKELEQALRLVELQVGPPPTIDRLAGGRPGDADTLTQRASTTPGSTVTASGLPIDPPGMGVLADPIMVNPDAAYTAAVQNAIIDAMLDYGQTLNLGGEEWLTVAARENSDTMIAVDLTDSVTITLRVRGADLEALRGGRATRDEVRQRVEVHEF